VEQQQQQQEERRKDTHRHHNQSITHGDPLSRAPPPLPPRHTDIHSHTHTYIHTDVEDISVGYVIPAHPVLQPAAKTVSNSMRTRTQRENSGDMTHMHILRKKGEERSNQQGRSTKWNRRGGGERGGKEEGKKGRKRGRGRAFPSSVFFPMCGFWVVCTNKKQRGEGNPRGIDTHGRV